MPTVTGKVTSPDLAGRTASVSFELVDGNNQPVRAFKTSTDETIVGPQSATLTDGAYSIVLPDNAGLNPSGTRWRRRIHLYQQTIDDALIVPVGGGPYVEEDILAEPVGALPAPVPTNLIDSATITANQTLGPGNPGVANAIANLIVTVPDLATPVLLRGFALLGVDVANAVVQLLIAPPGSTYAQRLVMDAALTGSTATRPGCKPELLLDPHSPGDYQLFAAFLALSAQTITVQALSPDRAFFAAYSA